MREVRAMNRAGRRNQVMLAFAIQIKHGLGDEMTAYEIARKIDLRATSPNFRDLLSQMEIDGLLKVREIKQPGRWDTKMYSPAAEIVTEKRSISIRANGRQVGQLELFS